MAGVQGEETEKERNEVNMDLRMADKAETLELESRMVVLKQRAPVGRAHPDHVGRKSGNYQ